MVVVKIFAFLFKIIIITNRIVDHRKPNTIGSKYISDLKDKAKGCHRQILCIKKSKVSIEDENQNDT
jgi:hypothetical protein